MVWADPLGNAEPDGGTASAEPDRGTAFRAALRDYASPLAAQGHNGDPNPAPGRVVAGLRGHRSWSSARLILGLGGS